MSDFRTPPKAAQVPQNTSGAHLNGHPIRKRPAKPKAEAERAERAARIIDPLEAQHGVIRQILSEGDVEKCRTAKRRTEEADYQEHCKTIIGVLWKQFEEPGAPLDFDTITDLLFADDNYYDAYTYLLTQIKPKVTREPRWEDCLRTVKNRRRVPQSTLLVRASGSNDAARLTLGLPLDDIGNGQRFAMQHGQAVRFCKPWNSWLIFDGRRWSKDEKDGIEARAKLTARSIIREAELTENENDRVALLKHAAATFRRAKRETMVKDAASEPGIGITPDELDTDKWALNVLNGTLDLKTGRLRPHNSADLITKLAPVAYDRGAPCPLWLQFLDKVFAGDAAMIDSVQRALGYALTGDTREQNFIIAQGGGSNGKSTLFQTVARILGDYALEIEPATIMVQKQERMAVDIADLFNVRFVVTSESNDTQRLDEAKMKKMTGGEQLTGERKFEHPFKFCPQFKLFLATNHLPEIRNTDNGIWRRVVTVPFDVAFWKEGEGSGAPELKADLQLSDKLQAEYPGILAWLVEGCLKWQRAGLTWPQKVRAKKEAYRQDQDVLGQFLADCCIIGASCSATAKELGAAYSQWCEANGERPISKTAFGKRLLERGFVAEHTKKARGWRGVGLKTDEDDPGEKGTLLEKGTEKVTRLESVTRCDTFFPEVVQNDFHDRRVRKTCHNVSPIPNVSPNKVEKTAKPRATFDAGAAYGRD